MAGPGREIGSGGVNGNGRCGRTRAALIVTAVLCVGLAGCQSQKSKPVSNIDPKLGVAASPRMVAENKPVPKGGGRYHVGNPYTIAGKVYTPGENTGYDSVGVASYYGRAFHGRKTANGEVFDMYALSAAHPTLPLPSYVRVTNLDNNRSVIVRVNDRGPFAHGRLIDVSHQAADMLGFIKTGTAKVRVQFVEVARLDGQDSKRLLASYRGPDLPSAPRAPATRPRPVLAAYAAAGAPSAARIVVPAGLIGETVPASELANGVPFNPHAVLAGPGRYALVAPVPTRDLFASGASKPVAGSRPAFNTGIAVTAYAAAPPRLARFAAPDALRAINRLLN